MLSALMYIKSVLLNASIKLFTWVSHIFGVPLSHTEKAPKHLAFA